MIIHIEDRLPNTGNRYRRLVVLIVIASAFSSMSYGCSSDDENSGLDDVTATSGTAGGASGASMQSGTGGVVAEKPLESGVGDGGPTANNEGGGGQAGLPTTDASTTEAGPQLDAAEDAPPMVDAADEAEPEPDCTPSDWVDPGTVANPEAIKVDPTTGTLGKPWGWTPPEALAQFDYVEEEWLIKGCTHRTAV